MLRIFLLTVLTGAVFLVNFSITAQSTDAETGLAMDSGWETVKATCTRCHSADIVRQNSGSRDAWKSRIIWMQETQGLEQLSENIENTILDYLSKNYPQKQATRRPPLAANLMPTYPDD